MKTKFGASRDAVGFFSSLNPRFYHPTQLLLRFSGWLILLFVGYHTFFDDVNHWFWLGFYFLYLAFLEIFLEKGKAFYDGLVFRWLRIWITICFVSWLIAISPDTRFILIFLFFVPLLATIVYFTKSFVSLALTFMGVGLGLYLGGVQFAVSNPFTWAEYTGIIFVLLGSYWIIWWIYSLAIKEPPTLANFGENLHKISDIKPLVDLVAETCGRLFASEQVLIIIRDPEYHRYITHANVGFHLLPGKSIEDLADRCYVLRTGNPYESADMLKKTFREKSIYAEFFTVEPRSIIAEPILGKDGAILGMISLTSTIPNYFSEWSQELAKHISYIASGAVENCIISRKVKLARSCENVVSDIFAYADHEEGVINYLGEESIQKAKGVAKGAFISVDEDRSLRILKTWPVGVSSFSDSDFEAAAAVAEKTFMTHESALIQNVAEHPWLQAVKDFAYKSLLVVPVMDTYNRNPIGALALLSDQKNGFSVAEEVLLFTLACQAGRQISNIRNFASWRFQGGKIKRIFDEFRKFDIDAGAAELCDNIAQAAINLLDFDLARIRLCDDQATHLETVAFAGVDDEIANTLKGTTMPFQVLKPFLTKRYQAGDSFIIPHTDLDWQQIAKSYFFVQPENSEQNGGWMAYDALLAPLKNQNGTYIGILSLDAPKNGRPTLQQMEAIDVFAKAAAWILERADTRRGLIEKQQRTMAFIESLSETVSGRGGIQGLGDIIVNIGVNLLSAEGCTLHLVQGEEIILTHSNYLSGIPFLQSRKLISEKPKSGLTAYVAATGSVMHYNDDGYKKHPAWAGERHHLIHLPSRRCISLLKVPIVATTGKVMGVLTLENKKRFGRIVGFDDQDVIRLKTLAHEVALILDVVDRYEKNRKWENFGYQDDLHELINWYHSGVYLYIETLEEWIKRGELERVHEHLPRLKNRALTTVDEMKTLHTAIVKQYLDEEDFTLGLRKMIDAWIDRYQLIQKDFHALKVETDCDPNLNLPIPLKNILLRIASNLVDNGLKHSGILNNPEVELWVTVQRTGNKVVLTVKDNGLGVEHLEKGYGLTRINQLVHNLNHQEKIDTKYTIATAPGKGMEVKITAII